MAHFSYEESNEKFLLFHLEGANYKLHDPGIETIETLIEAPSAEEFFCTGNLRETAINSFRVHNCNVFYLEPKIAEIELGKSEEDEGWEQQHYSNRSSHRRCSL